MGEKVNLFWFRRDLRLDDNIGLLEALRGDYPVLPIFIFDTEILEHLEKEDARVSFIHQNLEKIKEALLTHNSSLALYHNKPIEVFKILQKQYDIQEVFANHDYEPYAKQRDTEITEFLASTEIPFYTFKDQVIFEKDEVVKKDGDPYVVYSPYMRLWKEQLKNLNLEFVEIEDYFKNLLRTKQLPWLGLEDIGFSPSAIKVPVYDVSLSLLKEYEATRNYPGLDATSHLGPYLRFGVVSIRKIVALAVSIKNETFLNELIWREFFMQILYHYPHTVTEAFKKKYDRIQWRNNKAEFDLWKEGKTGYPLVDAGMRQLNATGFMHNRVRMLVGSFLCKHLLIDWRWGEAYFAEKLLDYEMSSNVGNWQWAAGSGVDAAPYFRIFNPTTQMKDYDKDNTYVKNWIKEFNTPNYPEMMVDHKEARERALRVYKEAVS